MVLHWIAGVAAFMILILVCAYRDALKQEPIAYFGVTPRESQQMNDADEGVERV